MNQALASGNPHFRKKQSGGWRSILLAVSVHILLLAFLWIGVRWQNKEATAVEAEVWDMTTREAAPKPVAVEEPSPEPEPVQTTPPPRPAVQAPVQKEDPQIALEQEKKRKLLEKKKEAEHQQELAEEKRRLDKELQVKKEKEREKLREQELEKERLREKDKEREKERDKERDKEREKQKLADQKVQQAKDKAASDKIFKEDMKRLAAQAGVTGSGGNGTAAKSTGNNRGDPSYAAKIAAKVRSNTIFNAIDVSDGNPTVEYRIELLPDGSLRGAIRKLKSSGIASFDEAVAKGIEKSAPFPKDKTGAPPPSIDLVYRMKEE
ncbi:cell envelope integrity protein TolA [Undibacterium sp. SXout7W]|uniref:cell envelope integrity protein TolA n=1 Tax=Undibacterium sp. SXout7W TaxID=3413049 RepID=UPI003BF3EADC